MKQLLFLLLFPCLCMAQYTGNAGQKITLGEQTTADGLVYRGIRADTASKIVPFSDTSAYIILDTMEKTLWLYKAGQIPKWQQVGGSTLDTATMLLPYWRSGRFSGVLLVANGGTGATSLSPNNYLIRTNSFGVFDTAAIFEAGGNVGIGTTAPNKKLELNGGGAYTPVLRIAQGTVNYFWDIGYVTAAQGNNLQFAVRDGPAAQDTKMTITYDGKVGIGTASPSQVLHVVGNARITAMNNIGDIGADANGVLQAAGASDVNLKNTIENSSFGLNEILLLNPVTFFYNNLDRKMDNDVKNVGFIAQDVFDIIPNAVSSMGDGDLQLDYRAITATLVKAVQEQNALIKALEQRIINLENK